MSAPLILRLKREGSPTADVLPLKNIYEWWDLQQRIDQAIVQGAAMSVMLSDDSPFVFSPAGLDPRIESMSLSAEP